MGFALKGDLLGRARVGVPSGGEIPSNPDVVEFCRSSYLEALWELGS